MKRINFRAAGIYIIRCKNNRRDYIGNSENIYIRLAYHVTALNGRRHPNREMQADWDKHGIEGFSFYILKRCEDRAARYKMESELLKKGKDRRVPIYNTFREYGLESRSFPYAALTVPLKIDKAIENYMAKYHAPD